MELREYKKGDFIQLTAVVQAPAGLDMAEARAYLEGDQSKSIDLFKQSDETQKKVQITLSARVAGKEAPGVYTCSVIRLFDSNGESTTHPLSPPRQFRIIPGGGIAAPAEVIEVGDFE